MIGNRKAWYIGIQKQCDGSAVERNRNFSSDILKALGHDGFS